MSKSLAFENDLLLLIFNAVDIALIADDTLTTPLADLFVSLHTSDPGEGGTQNTGEIAYTGYGRVSVSRDGAGWTVTASLVNPTADIDFGEMSGGAGGTVTHFAVGVLTSGAGKLLYFGTVTPNIVVSTGVTPRLTTATQIDED